MRRLLIFAGVVVGLIFAVTVWGVVRLVSAQQAIVAGVKEVSQGAEGEDFQIVRSGLMQVQQGIVTAERARPLLFVGEIIPVVRNWYRESDDVMLAAHELVKAGTSVVDALDEVQSVLRKDPLSSEMRSWEQLSSIEKETLLRTIQDQAVTLLSAKANIQLARTALSRVDTTRLPGAVGELLGVVDKTLGEVDTTLGVLAPLFTVVTDLTGAGDGTEWLVLYLNSSELRPGGGFIGFYALMDIKNGEILSSVAEDTYAVDVPAASVSGYHVTPPEPMRRRLGVPSWFFRDAAWDPDFAGTAKTAVQLLRQERAVVGATVPDPEFVLGITPEAVAALVRRTGPLQLQGRTVTADELYGVLQYDTQQGFAEAGRPDTERKTLVAEATKAMLDRLFTLPPEQLFSLLSVMNDEAAGKHVAVYSKDERVQSVFMQMGWSGTLPTIEAGDDALMLIDANLGALKTDPVVSRHLAYTVDFSAPSPTATVTATYVHSGAFDYKTTHYLSHTELWTPPGTHADPQWLDIPPGATKTYTWTYPLDPAVLARLQESGDYTLHLPKQLGSGDNQLTLNLHFDRTLSAASPAETGTYHDETYTFEGVLDQDRTVTLQLAPYARQEARD